MKNIKIKLSISDYKYLCLLVKQSIDAVKEFDTPIAYCTLVLLKEEYPKLIKKLPKAKKTPSIVACVSFSLYSLLYSYIQQGIYQNKFDHGNFILVQDLLRILGEEIKNMEKEENMITDLAL